MLKKKVEEKLNSKSNIKDNVNITLKEGKENTKEIKSGTVADIPIKIKESIDRNKEIVGMSKGATINMGDYQSLRIDIWCSEELKDIESRQDVFTRLSKEIDEQLEIEVQMAKSNLN